MVGKPLQKFRSTKERRRKRETRTVYVLNESLGIADRKALCKGWTSEHNGVKLRLEKRSDDDRQGKSNICFDNEWQRAKNTKRLFMWPGKRKCVWRRLTRLRASRELSVVSGYEQQLGIDAGVSHDISLSMVQSLGERGGGCRLQ